MTIDEAIKHCREVAEKKEKLANTYESFQDCGNSKSSLTSGREKCLKCAEEHKQLATWLEELKALKEQPSGDCIRRADANLTDFEILMCDGDYKEALKLLLDKIKKAPSVTPQPNKWIAISKETPSKCGWYITTTIYNETYCDYWDGDRFNRSEVIIAWMELPEPYRAESEEE